MRAASTSLSIHVSHHLLDSSSFKGYVF